MPSSDFLSKLDKSIDLFCKYSAMGTGQMTGKESSGFAAFKEYMQDAITENIMLPLQKVIVNEKKAGNSTVIKVQVAFSYKYPLSLGLVQNSKTDVESNNNQSRENIIHWLEEYLGSAASGFDMLRNIISFYIKNYPSQNALQDVSARISINLIISSSGEQNIAVDISQTNF